MVPFLSPGKSFRENREDWLIYFGVKERED
jgi:hypothetical protein